LKKPFSDYQVDEDVPVNGSRGWSVLVGGLLVSAAFLIAIIWWGDGDIPERSAERIDEVQNDVSVGEAEQAYSLD